MLNPLSPYSRLVLAHLHILPNQSLESLMYRTGCDRRATVKETLRLLILMNLVERLDNTRYALTVAAEESFATPEEITITSTENRMAPELSDMGLDLDEVVANG